MQYKFKNYDLRQEKTIYGIKQERAGYRIHIII